MTERFNPFLKVNVGTSPIWAVTFTANGEHLVSGHKEVRVWRVQDGRQVATMAVGGDVICLAVSKDGRWIAAGASESGLYIWDANTYKQVFQHADVPGESVLGVEFSPDSTRCLVSSRNNTATVWDLAARERVLGPLHHKGSVIAAKFSPRGDQIATATTRTIRVFDSNDGHQIGVAIKANVIPYYNTGLHWLDDGLLVMCDNKIKQIETSTGSVVSEWPAPDADYYSCIALPQHRQFIACSIKRTVTLWDTSTHTQFGLVHDQDIRSITLSPDNQFIAIAGKDGKMSVYNLFRTSLTAPGIHVDDATIDSWSRGQLKDTDALLTKAIVRSPNPDHHVLAGRALVRARLQQWDAAVSDAKESIQIHPSVIAYIAMSVALLRKGEILAAYRACDLAFEHCDSSYVCFLLLAKAIIAFMATEHEDALARVDDLIVIHPSESIYYVVQAYMLLSLGKTCKKNDDHDGAIRWFRRAVTRHRHHGGQIFLVISMLFGWKFDDLGITIQQCLCESLYAAGRLKEGVEALLEMVNAFEGQVYAGGPITKWVSDFTRQCLSTPQGCDNADLEADKHAETTSAIPASFLTVWAKSTLARGKWKDALPVIIDFTVPRFMIYRALCEHLEMVNCVLDAIECFAHSNSELAGDVTSCDEWEKWALDFKLRCAAELEHLGDAAADAKEHDNAIAQYSAALSLDPAIPQEMLIKRSKVYVTKGLWSNALEDTARDQVMALVPSSKWGFENVLTEWAKLGLQDASWKNVLLTANSLKAPKFAIYRALCERLEAINRIKEAVECFHTMQKELVSDIQSDDAMWVFEFKSCCLAKLEGLGDTAISIQRCEKAISYYSAALSLDPTIRQDLLVKRSKAHTMKGTWKDALDDANEVMKIDPSSSFGYGTVLAEWAKVTLANGSWKTAMETAGGFEVPIIVVCRALCERLETMDRVMDATQCFLEIAGKPGQGTDRKWARWVLGFKSRCCGKLEDGGDTAISAQQYNQAIFQYSAALSLDPIAPQGLLIKRSKAYLANELPEDALNDANKVITIDPSSPWGHERKHAALIKAGDYENAVNSFEAMVSMMLQSPDPKIRERSHKYVNPEQTKAAIRIAIQDTIRDSPPVLVNTNSGRLLDNSAQASLFESQPIFAEMMSSMTTYIDHVRIKQEVVAYYRYATFSHKWEENEPLYEKVMRTPVCDLEDSPTHRKLQMFCKIVRESEIHWAWSDTCCINKADHIVLQEALVSMFKWYKGSALTIVFLCDVGTWSRAGDLGRSIWNTRAWTFQEYHASDVVRFYTKDWTLYLSLNIPNHKESPDIISEMETVTGVLARSLTVLRPGSDDVREKLRLASTRKTTRIEDAAYSLLGIFSVAMPIVYGEGDQALGRLLAQVLTSSGDTSILAWTGKPSNFNSCLPADIVVFSQLPTSHIPSTIESAAMGLIINRLQAAPLNYGLVMVLCDRLNELSTPLFVGQRLRLPCITFKLGPISASRDQSNVFRAQTAILGVVKIKTQEDLSRLESLYLVYPWIDYLLDKQPVESVIVRLPEEGQNDLSVEPPSFPHRYPSNVPSATPRTRATRLVSRLGLPFGGRSAITSLDVTSLRPPSTILETDKQMEALRVIARLRQPFGALLLTPKSGNVAAYRRVATESLITVEVKEMTPVVLNKLVESVRTIDVL